ncbi:HAD family hydrolase [Acetobacterium sp.]|uniref:HAD family hydrolase n=1 Tax=Acetobacterium sp. TaxID=1872094 RepID=UPI002717CEE0|nr:HAD family hydrolase [Acetobacterium sp.]MDO9490777.1 HAD family hydrolase [Acetobacterium sp.]
MTIKMIVTDLDGTLLNSTNTISDRNIQAFRKVINMGIIPVVATGRIDSEALFFAQSIGAMDYLISGSGGVIKDYKNEKIIHEVDLDRKNIKELLRIVEPTNEIFWQAYTNKGCVCTEQSLFWMDRSGWAKAHVEEFKDKQIVVTDVQAYVDDQELGISKFVLSSTNYVFLDELMNKIGMIDGVEVIRPMDYCVECIPTGVDKGFGLIKLCEYLKIKLKEVMVIGDSDNDREMFEVCGPLKIAMGNAKASIKDLATHIVSSNDEDGVAEAIYEFIINEKLSR